MDSKELQNLSKVALWIIEYVWAHNMMDVQQGVDPSIWPNVDSQPLNLEDSWRLRVTSARAYSVVKNRDKRRYERVLVFLEDAYQLLPTLVPAIKHMKLMFGLQTMVIMWMLKEGCASVDVVQKITQFFSNKLPRYQDRCVSKQITSTMENSKREMFLMRKNQLDFKAFAQSLAINKKKLEEYVKSHMEEQYGERYAQKVEERLLHYLRELDNALTRDTHIDQILKKNSPVNDEEKLLLDIIASDSTTIATTLQRLLRCDAASCYSQKLEDEAGSHVSELSKSLQCTSSSKALLTPVDSRTSQSLQPEVVPEGEAQVWPIESHVLLENTVSEVIENIQMEEHDKVLEMLPDGSYVGNVSAIRCTSQKEEADGKDIGEISTRSDEPAQDVTSPQFCSRHQRWVKNILRQCPDECSEELLLQSGASSSPPLFQSSFSISSSEDITPSDLVITPEDPPSQTFPTSRNFQIVSEKGDGEEKLSSGSLQSNTKTSPPADAHSSRDTLLAALCFPVVRLIDIASVQGLYPHLKPSQISTRATASLSCTTLKSHSETHKSSQSTPSSTLGSLEVRILQAQPQSSPQSQPDLLHSKLLQPRLILSRLSPQECHKLTKGRSLNRDVQSLNDDDQETTNGGNQGQHCFPVCSESDVTLYSTDSSDSDFEDSRDSDPDYKPRIKWKRYLLQHVIR